MHQSVYPTLRSTSDSALLQDVSDCCNDLLSKKTLDFRLAKGSARDLPIHLSGPLFKPESTVPQWDLIRFLNKLERDEAETAYPALQKYVHDDLNSLKLTFPLKERYLVDRTLKAMTTKEEATSIFAFIPGEWIMQLLEILEGDLKVPQDDPSVLHIQWIAGYISLVGVLECQCQIMELQTEHYTLGYDPSFVSKFKYALETVTRLSKDFPKHGPSVAPLVELKNRIGPRLMTSINKLVNGPVLRFDIERLLQSMEFLKPLDVPSTMTWEVDMVGMAVKDTINSAVFAPSLVESKLDAWFGKDAYKFLIALFQSVIYCMVYSFPLARARSVGVVTTISHTLLPMGLKDRSLMRVRIGFDATSHAANQLLFKDAQGFGELKKALATAISTDLKPFMRWLFEGRYQDLVVLTDYPPDYSTRPSFRNESVVSIALFKRFDEGGGSSKLAAQAGGRSNTKKAKRLTPEQEAKVGYVLGEFKRGTLKSSNGKRVTDEGMAKAIALSEARRFRTHADGREDEGLSEDQERVYAKLMGRFARGTLLDEEGRPVGNRVEAEQRAYDEAVGERGPDAWRTSFTTGGGTDGRSQGLRHLRLSKRRTKDRPPKEEMTVKKSMGAGGRDSADDNNKRPQRHKNTHAFEFRRGQWRRKIGY